MARARFQIEEPTGECEFSWDKVVGIAVHIGARVIRKSKPGEVIVLLAVEVPVTVTR